MTNHYSISELEGALEQAEREREWLIKRLALTSMYQPQRTTDLEPEARIRAEQVAKMATDEDTIRHAYEIIELQKRHPWIPIDLNLIRELLRIIREKKDG